MGDYPENIKNYFPEEEQRCHCGCNQNHTSPVLLEKLNLLRHDLGRPLIANCMYRCPTHDLNIYLGKLKKKLENRTLKKDEYHRLVKLEKEKIRTSSHIKGLAADIKANSRDKYEILEANFQRVPPLFNRILVYDTFLHLDCDESKDQNIVVRMGY